MPDAIPRTLPELLIRAAKRWPDKGIGLLDGRGRNLDRRTYPELLAQVEATAGRLAGRGVRAGDRVFVALPTSWQWFDSWFGALFAGALPVALAGGGAMGIGEAQVRKLETVRQLLDPRLILGSERLIGETRALGYESTAALTISPETLQATPQERARRHGADPDAAAFLQLTSGSTGAPRAVMISHRAAVHHGGACSEAIGAPFGSPADAWGDAMVSWLPLHHDMGLVGGVLFPMWSGFEIRLLPPHAFLARPRLWLEQLGQNGVTVSPAPNFAYQLCVERLAEGSFDVVDLSPWQAALIGAEMIRPETMDDFATRFGRHGLDSTHLRPCYGLAEGTLALTFDRRGVGPRTRTAPPGADGSAGNSVICVGEPVIDTEIRIVGPTGQPLPEGSVGEVHARGPGIFLGYYGDPEATSAGLIDGWLATGDLGFLADDELYLTGRIKDVLIVRGQNLMPHELEWLAEGVVGGGGRLRSGAFSVPRGAEGEVAVVVLELEDAGGAGLAEIEHQVRVAIGRSLSLPLADVAFVRRGRIPRTTSGKVQRRELRRLYLAGELDRLSTEI